MSLYPLSLDDLTCWEEWLDRLNSSYIVPDRLLGEVLSSEDKAVVSQREVKSCQNIPYNAAHAHLSKRYVNEAWIWAEVLKPLFPVERVTELCGGASVLIDLALSYLRFDRSFLKIDYEPWDHLERYEIKKEYQQSFQDLNVITETESIPKSDLMILNHSVDDLFMGLWNEHHRQDYWDIFCDWEKVDAYWALAMQEGSTFEPVLQEFIKQLATRLSPGGHLILRDYPSAYETHRQQFQRIHFTRALTQLLASELKLLGMVQRHPTLNASYPPLVSDSFFIFHWHLQDKVVSIK